MRRVVISTNIPAPYTVDFLNLLAEKCELTVVFHNRTSRDRDPSWFGRIPIKFRAIFLSDDMKKPGIFSLLKYMLSSKYDARIMYGYSSAAEIVAILVMKYIHRKYIIAIDGAIMHSEGTLKKKMKDIVISGASAYLSPSTESDNYLKYYGAREEHIYRYHFSSLRQEDIIYKALSFDKKNQIRKQLGMKGKIIYISVGNFIHRKGFDVLLKAWKGMPADASLYIVGGKPTEEYLSIIEQNGLKNVFFISHVTKERLTQLYLASDICTFPTRYDIWGLVVNEALGNGLPVITTNRCVAALEIIKNGFNGYIIPTEDEDELRKTMLFMYSVNRSEYSVNCIESIRQYTIENMANEYINAIESIDNYSI